jgi:hypothetical protein
MDQINQRYNLAVIYVLYNSEIVFLTNLTDILGVSGKFSRWWTGFLLHNTMKRSLKNHENSVDTVKQLTIRCSSDRIMVSSST